MLHAQPRRGEGLGNNYFLAAVAALFLNINLDTVDINVTIHENFNGEEGIPLVILPLVAKEGTS